MQINKQCKLINNEIATQILNMQVYPSNEFGLATPLQLRLALRALYYLDTVGDTCMKTKIIIIYCNTS